MESSLTLLSAHIQFLETRLALIHIPLDLYSHFLQAILQLLLRNEASSDSESSNGEASSLTPSIQDAEPPFLNVSVTNIECSIACSRSSADELFVPARNSLDPALRDQVSITNEDFVVMQVDGEGLDAGQRVLDLTSPLAMAGISIFFITTYFADYILVPHRSRTPVIKALEARGFAFDMSTSTYTNASHSRNHSSSSNETAPPGTPPPASISELQTRTFATLKRRNIVPTVDPAIRLVHCAGRRDTDLANGSRPSANHTAEDKLQLGLVKCLICTPRFLSLTLTDTEPASLLLEKRLLANFPGDDDVLLGSKDDILIPITLDLRGLPLESTGIVCGVASRLVGGTTAGLEGPVEMSYLSTARAGTVMVAEEEIERAIWALRGAENGVRELGD